MSFYQHSAAIYLRSRSCLVDNISSDTVTEHWCQVCVPPMMSLPSWRLVFAAPTASFGKFDCVIGNMSSDEYRWKDPKWRSYRYIFLQARTHSITINQHNSVSRTFSVANWSEMCGLVDVLTVLLSSPTRLISINSGRDREYMMPRTRYIYIYIYNPLDNRHSFSISIGNTKNHAATLFFLEWHTVKICQHFPYRLLDNA